MELWNSQRGRGLTSSLNPTTELNVSATYKTSHFTESGFANDYQITDKTTGSTGFQGLGYFQNPANQDYGFNIDLQKPVRLQPIAHLLHRRGSTSQI